MKIGFTGTQRGMTINQKNELINYFKLHRITFFHHGDCIGADAQAHEIARNFNIDIMIHPPKNKFKRSFCKNYYNLYKPKEYIARNHDIVNNTDVLIACPKSVIEELRSGTWSTVRYARKKGKPVIIFNP